MPNADPNTPPVIDTNVRLAEERTLLAWVRTGLAMMGFGFVVARFGMFLRAVAGDKTPGSHSGGLWLGTALIVLGVLVNLLAARQHMSRIRRWDRGERQVASRGMLAMWVALGLAAIGVAMAVYLVASYS
jgi:putative membrane protein